MKARPDTEIAIKTRKRGHWTRVFAEESGRDVSHLSYGPRRLRMGRSGMVRMAAIGGVATDSEFRRRGLAGQVFARAMDEIRREGYSCVGLYTSARIVAHRLYRRFGLVDVIRSPRGYKLLDPERVVCDALNAILEGRAAGTGAVLLAVELRAHEPVFLRIEGGRARAVRRPRREADLSVTMSGDTFLALWQRDITFAYAEEAKLVEWRGDESCRRRLGEALARRRKQAHEG